MHKHINQENKEESSRRRCGLRRPSKGGVPRELLPRTGAASSLRARGGSEPGAIARKARGPPAPAASRDGRGNGSPSLRNALTAGRSQGAELPPPRLTAGRASAAFLLPPPRAPRVAIATEDCARVRTGMPASPSTSCGEGEVARSTAAPWLSLPLACPGLYARRLLCPSAHVP